MYGMPHLTLSSVTGLVLLQLLHSLLQLLLRVCDIAAQAVRVEIMITARLGEHLAFLNPMRNITIISKNIISSEILFQAEHSEIGWGQRARHLRMSQESRKRDTSEQVRRAESETYLRRSECILFYLKAIQTDHTTAVRDVALGQDLFGFLWRK